MIVLKSTERVSRRRFCTHVPLARGRLKDIFRGLFTPMTILRSMVGFRMGLAATSAGREPLHASIHSCVRKRLNWQRRGVKITGDDAMSLIPAYITTTAAVAIILATSILI